MTPDPRLPPPPAPADLAGVRPRQRWALVAGVAVVVGLGAVLGQGLGPSLAGLLSPGWQGALPALVGATVALLLVPLSGWAAVRLLTSPPSQPAGSGLRAGGGSGKFGRFIRSGKAAPGTVNGSGADALAQGGVDPQAPARDALTGAYTQLHFLAATDREWSRIRRHGEDAALLMVDVDHFKRLNDEHGMPCSDAMLVEITRQAASTLRPYDLLARFGGGVLVIYLPHTDPLGALDVAERIRDRVVGLRLNWHGKKVKATISVGVAGIGVAHAALEAVIADAGAALREAKAAGRNCVRAAPIPPRRNTTAARSTG